MNTVKLAKDIVRIASSFEDYVSLYLQSGEEAIAYNQSSWSWEYDENDRYAVVFRDIARGSLRLVVFEVRIKTGLGAGERQTLLTSSDLGTVKNPKIGLISGVLSRYNQREHGGSSFGKQWRQYNTKQQATLSSIISQYSLDTVEPTEVSEDVRIRLDKALKEVSIMVKDGTKTKKEMKEYLERAIAKLIEIKEIL